jgi:PST family polysaccharide transporter
LRPKVQRFFDENKGRPDLGRKSLHSGAIFVAARTANLFVQFVSMVVLARLLTPHDYGLVAIVFALLGFAPMLIDLGSSDASVQKARIAHADLSTLFFLNLTIGTTLTLLLIGVSPFVASAYGEPALTGIALASTLLFMVTALSAQHYALMRRAMEFRRIALIDICANVISCVVAIAMAYTGWGYWALVARPILASGLAAAGIWASCPWVPGQPRITPAVKEMLRFGLGVTGFTMTDHLARSTDRVVLGYFYGAAPLGYFQNAFLLYDNVLGLLTQPLHNVAVSSLSKLKNEVEELKRSWRMALSSLTFLSCLGFAGLAVTAQDVVVVLLGQKWEPAGPLLSIFAVRGIAHVVERTLGWLHVAAGRSDRWMRWGLFSALFQLAALLTGVPFGLAGVAVAHTIATFCLFLPALVYAGRPFGIDSRHVISTVGPQMVAGLATVAIGIAVQWLFLWDYTHVTRIALSIPVCMAVYFAVAVGMFRVTDPIRLGISLIHDFAPARLRGSWWSGMRRPPPSS